MKKWISYGDDCQNERHVTLNMNDLNPTELPQPTHRVEGITEAERYLQKLSERTFLRLWSYAGVFRDQGRPLRAGAGAGSPTRVGDGKELCDLLVVFQNHLIIFSDKDCTFPETDNLDLAWSRWYRKAIQGGASQVWGAERWIRSYPGTLFLDRLCTEPFPLDLPDLSMARVHRIVVAHGADERCKRELGGSGSLMIAPSIVGPQHLLPRNEGGMPFAVGVVDLDQGYVHVLDDTSLDILLGTLDTVADFVAYLEKKESLILSGKLAGASGEEDLLAFYLKDINEQGEHDFVVPPRINSIVIAEGEWESFKHNPQRLAQIAANEVSYVWDQMIEEFTGHAFAGTLNFTTDPGLKAQDRILGYLAREPRTRRRMLAETLLDMMQTTPTGTRRTRVMIPSDPGDPHYVFLTLPPPANRPYEEYRTVRRNLLEACCMAAKDECPDVTDIVGIATEPFPYERSSQDILYFDANEWTDEQQKEAEEVRKKIQLLQKIDRFHTTVQEYPELGEFVEPELLSDRIVYIENTPEHSRFTVDKPGPNPRNKPCPCGSGRKYKKCCGR